MLVVVFSVKGINDVQRLQLRKCGERSVMNGGELCAIWISVSMEVQTFNFIAGDDVDEESYNTVMIIF